GRAEPRGNAPAGRHPSRFSATSRKGWGACSYSLHSSLTGHGALASAYFFASIPTSSSTGARSADSRSDAFTNLVPSHSSIQAPERPVWFGQELEKGRIMPSELSSLIRASSNLRFSWPQRSSSALTTYVPK